jgi:hypothetical protein
MLLHANKVNLQSNDFQDLQDMYFQDAIQDSGSILKSCKTVLQVLLAALINLHQLIWVVTTLLLYHSRIINSQPTSHQTTIATNKQTHHGTDIISRFGAIQSKKSRIYSNENRFVCAAL